MGRRCLLRASRRRLHRRGKLCRGDRAARLSRRSGRNRGRAHAAGRFSRQTQLGLRWRAAVCARRELWRPGRAQAPHRCGAFAFADGFSGRRVQPFRARRQLPSRLRSAVLQPCASHAVGRGHQLRRRAKPHRARLLHSQRALLARGVPFRRAASGRGGLDRRRILAGYSRRARFARARGARRRAAHTSGARKRSQRSALPGPRRAAAAPARNSAVERRHSSRGARRGNRRGGRLLCGLRRAAAVVLRALPDRGLRLSGRTLAVSWQQRARGAVCAPAAGRLCLFSANP